MTKSIKLQMRDAIEAIEREKLTSDDVISFDAYRYTMPRVHVTEEAIIRLFHQLKIARNAVTATVSDSYLHVHFKSRGIVYLALVKLEKAATFIDSKQRQLPAPTAKRIGTSDQRRLAFSGSGE